jgi:urease accessory protein
MDRVVTGVAIIGSIAVCPSLAQAHSPIQGLGTFYGHLLHPVFVPAHALLLAAAALMLGQQGRKAARIGLVALGLAFAAGLTAAKAGLLDGVREQILLFGALLIGGAVGIGMQMPATLTTLAAAGAGVAIGLDSATNALVQREAILAFAGVTIGVLYFAILITGSTVGLTAHWHRIGVRIAGSWIVAISVMVLALSIAVPAKHTAVATGVLLGQMPPW